MIVKNLFSAGAAASVDELRDAVGSLEAQLAALYAEKERGAWSGQGVVADGGGELMAIYQAHAGAAPGGLLDGGAANAQLVEMVGSLQAEVAALRAEQQEQGGDEALRLMVASFDAQLAALYGEKQHEGDTISLRIMVESFDAQLAALYDAQVAYGAPETLSAKVRSLEAELVKLRAERARTLEMAQAMVEALVSQSFGAA